MTVEQVKATIDKVWVEFPVDQDGDPSYLERTAADHYGENGSNWDHVDDEHKDNVISAYGSIMAACEAYAERDAGRLRDYGNGWHFVGCVAHATVSYPVNGNGDRRLESFSSGGLWGIESDSANMHLWAKAREQLNDLGDHLQRFGVDMSGYSKQATGAVNQV